MLQRPQVALVVRAASHETLSARFAGMHSHSTAGAKPPPVRTITHGAAANACGSFSVVCGNNEHTNSSISQYLTQNLITSLFYIYIKPRIFLPATTPVTAHRSISASQPPRRHTYPSSLPHTFISRKYLLPEALIGTPILLLDPYLLPIPAQPPQPQHPP